MNKPGSANYNDDDALLTTLQKSRGEQERKQTYQCLVAGLEEELASVPDRKSVLPRTWGMLMVWIKEQRTTAPLRRPLATYFLGFFRMATGTSTTGTDKYRYRYLPKQALVALAPDSEVCRAAIALRFEDSCYRILNRYYSTDRSGPQEIYGEAITDLFANLPRPRQPETASLFTYFMTIAKRKYGRYLSLRDRQPAPMTDAEQWDIELKRYDAGYSLESQDFADVLVECKEIIANQFVFENEGELVRKLLKLLQPNYREALMLRFLEGMDYNEIAEQLACTPENARARVHRGLNKLRQLLNRRQ